MQLAGPKGHLLFMIKNLLLLLALTCQSEWLQAQNNVAKKPVKSYEKLWSTFDKHYANFDLKGIDWDSINQVYAPLITDSTATEVWFDSMCNMVQTLNDGHVYLSGKVNGEKVECGPPYDFFFQREFSDEGAFKSFVEVVHNTLLTNEFDSLTVLPYTRNSSLRYSTSQDYGYLRISGMAEGITLGRLNRSMKEIMSAISDKKGLIIDLRLNGGGWDVTSYKFAGRFIDKKTVGHYKETRKKGKSSFKAKNTWTLKPKGPVQYTKPIVILTSDFTASAAEIFLLAMQQFPYVKVVGEPSEGIFSDMYGFRLPNGFKASLSNQRYYDVDGINFEGKGIPVDEYVIHSKDDLKTGVDPLITSALGLLNNKAAWNR
jgi:hypothetical protein